MSWLASVNSHAFRPGVQRPARPRWLGRVIAHAIGILFVGRDPEQLVVKSAHYGLTEDLIPPSRWVLMPMLELRIAQRRKFTAYD